MEEIKPKLRQKLKKPYRLVVLKEDSLEEVGSFRLTPLSLYILFSSLFVGLAIIVALTIIFTPVKRWIPGYGDGQMHPQVTKLRAKITDMENQLELQKRYTESIRKMLTGDVLHEEIGQEEIELQDSLKDVARIEEDELLRQGYLTGEGLVTSSTQGSSEVLSEIPLERMIFTVPAIGQTSAGYSIEDNHLGIDIIAPRNTPIRAAMDGFVFFSDWTLETGNSIGIMHAHNVVTFYKHNSTLLKKAGQYVRAGEAIAIIGNTGTMTSGPHLHFELWHKGKTVDPAKYIRF